LPFGDAVSLRYGSDLAATLRDFRADASTTGIYIMNFDGSSTPAAPGRARPLVALLLGVWLVAVGAGMFVVTRYAATPGAAAAAAPAWPEGASIARGRDVPTLLLFLHPKCPCSRASVAELSAVVAKCPAKVAARVVFWGPPGAGADWFHTDLWDDAAALPGVDVVVDPGGVETRRFGAATSGQVLLYDTSGRLVFRGGITAGRGHAGDNAGRDGVVAFLNHGTVPAEETPVFGCSFDDELTSPDEDSK
jgi:hypothetical protein